MNMSRAPDSFLGLSGGCRMPSALPLSRPCRPGAHASGRGCYAVARSRTFTGWIASLQHSEARSCRGSGHATPHPRCTSESCFMDWDTATVCTSALCPGNQIWYFLRGVAYCLCTDAFGIDIPAVRERSSLRLETSFGIGSSRRHAFAICGFNSNSKLTVGGW